ncbi:hypothetical protein [Nocardioides montaniterrae]
MSEIVMRARARARRARDRWIDQTLQKLEQARVAIEADEADVLVLAESSCLAWAYADTDTTLVPDLIAEQSGQRVVPIAGAGYDARMFDALIGSLSGMAKRPKAVVVAINVRTNTSTGVIAHPVHGHPRSLQALAALGPISGPVKAFGYGGTVQGKKEIEEFRTVPITTRWGGTSTTGEHLARLEGQGPPPWPIELERGRFDYFHGEVVGDDHPALESLASLGESLVAYGVPVVGYWALPPVEHGESLFPGEFAQHVAANLDKVERALDLEGHGFDALVRPVLAEDEFQDARNGTEHYAYAGRVKVAATVSENLQNILS